MSTRRKARQGVREDDEDEMEGHGKGQEGHYRNDEDGGELVNAGVRKRERWHKGTSEGKRRERKRARRTRRKDTVKKMASAAYSSRNLSRASDGLMGEIVEIEEARRMRRKAIAKDRASKSAMRTWAKLAASAGGAKLAASASVRKRARTRDKARERRG